MSEAIISFIELPSLNKTIVAEFPSSCVIQAVDVETEKQIRDAIGALTGKRTIIAIAHRLSTIRSARQILVIENGTVIERGTHEELLSFNGPYARMNDIQKENE